MRWDEACARARSETEFDVEAGKASAPWPLIVVDHFDLTMLDMSVAGARLRVTPLNRLQAVALAHRTDAPAIALNDRGQNMLEKELQMEPARRPQVRYGTDLLVVQVVRWNDLRFFLVEYEADGDGCVP